MKKKWFRYFVILPLFMSLLASSGQSRAADGTVGVTLPGFTVTLNGHIVENQYREYPLLVYKGITYFPMTWYDSRLLGLEATWSFDNGLKIKQSQVTSSYVPNKSKTRNTNAYDAKIITSVVTINGKTIDNTKEKYPLLSFRNVTYFPLTWRFAYDEFRWDYKWNDKAGLSITSNNPQLQIVGLPAYAGGNDIALFKGYYYFVETTDMTNHVYRAPVQQPFNKEEIYSYKISELQKDLSFQIRDNALWFVYHLGEGGIMGHNEYVKIGDDGKTELRYRGYLDFRDTKYGTLIINFGNNLDSGSLNLLQMDMEGTNPKNVGDQNMMRYAQHVVKSVANNVKTATSVVGDEVYVLCSIQPTGANMIYKINLKTDQTDKIVNSDISWFKVIDNKLYFVKIEDNMLYSSDLNGEGEMKLSDHTVAWFDSIQGNVFYTTKKETNQFELYQANANGVDRLVWTTPFADVQVLNGQLVCHFNGGVILLDGSGHLILSVAESISRMITSDEGILLESARDSMIKFIR